MRNTALILMMFLLNNCSFHSLFLSKEINKVMVVKYSPYVKRHRAYFARMKLKTIEGSRKYKFLYNPKKQELALMLHKRNLYTLYNFTQTDAPTLSIEAKGNTTYEDVLKVFKHKGYISKSLNALGYIPSVSLRRYKGIKTLMIEVKDYHRLKKLYLNAIKNYNAKKIKSIKTVLPKSLIYSYYEKYRKQSKTKEQRAQLRIIAHTLKFNSNLPKITNSSKKITTIPKSAKKSKIKKKVSKELTLKKTTTKKNKF